MPLPLLGSKWTTQQVCVILASNVSMTQLPMDLTPEFPWITLTIYLINPRRNCCNTTN